MNFEKVTQVLAAERGLCDGSLYEAGDQGHLCCALGALLFAQGFTNEQLSAMDPGLAPPTRFESGPDGYRIVEIEDSLEVKANRVLKEVYGIDQEDMEAIMSMNDQEIYDNEGYPIEEDPIARRDRIVNYLRQEAQNA